MSVSKSSAHAAHASWPDHRTVWRWHFYAGLFCAPFVMVLAASGSIYLFKTEIEAWIDRGVDRLATAAESPGGGATSVARQAAAALAAVPGATLKTLELPEPAAGGAGTVKATRVIVELDGEASRVFVHPVTTAILKIVPEQDRFMRKIFRLHGELWMRDRGSMLVELAASWTIVMILTGLFLWWPRECRGLAGVVYPRLRGGRRVFWRDIHAVTGVWISGLALALLLSGLPWAKSWGNYFKLVRSLTGTAVASQDWSNGGAAVPLRTGGDDRGGHAGHGGGRRGEGRPLRAEELEALDRICAAVRPLGLEAPVLIAPPRKDGGGWSVKSDTANRPRRVELVVNGDSGAIESRRDFRDKHPIDKVVAYGTAAHEGRLFGWPNQLLGLLTAVGLVLMSVSGIVMWWRRRPQGVLGAPPAAPAGSRRSIGLIAAIMALAIYLPLFGLSLAAVLLLEWLVVRRIPALRNWLGLAPSV